MITVTPGPRLGIASPRTRLASAAALLLVTTTAPAALAANLGGSFGVGATILATTTFFAAS